MFKLDWALDGPVPWAADGPRRAATIHLGGTLDEIAASEADVAAGRHPDKPYVLFVQYAPWDTSRAPAGKTTAWAYCHVPAGSDVDMTDRIEAQVERFAPGFRDRILARAAHGPAALEAHDANNVGGDINGGLEDIRQLIFRPWPAIDPYRVGDGPVPVLVVDAAGRRGPRHVRDARCALRPAARAAMKVQHAPMRSRHCADVPFAPPVRRPNGGGLARGRERPAGAVRRHS